MADRLRRNADAENQRGSTLAEALAVRYGQWRIAENPDPEQTTIGDVFRVVNGIRREQNEMRTAQNELRAENADFRTSVEERLDEILAVWADKRKSALNVALHVLGEQRGTLREIIDWANSQGAHIEKLP